jgi:hypothetical protein
LPWMEPIVSILGCPFTLSLEGKFPKTESMFLGCNLLLWGLKFLPPAVLPMVFLR